MNSLLVTFLVIALTTLLSVDAWPSNPFKKGKDKVAKVEGIDSGSISSTDAISSPPSLSDYEVTKDDYSYNYETYGSVLEEEESSPAQSEGYEDEDDSDFMFAQYSYSFGSEIPPPPSPPKTELSIVVEAAIVLSKEYHDLDLENPSEGLNSVTDDLTTTTIRVITGEATSSPPADNIRVEASILSIKGSEAHVSLHLTQSDSPKLLRDRGKLLSTAIHSGLFMKLLGEDLGTPDGVVSVSYLSSQKLKLSTGFDENSWRQKAKRRKLQSTDSYDDGQSYGNSYSTGIVIDTGGGDIIYAAITFQNQGSLFDYNSFEGIETSVENAILSQIEAQQIVASVESQDFVSESIVTMNVAISVSNTNGEDTTSTTTALTSWLNSESTTFAESFASELSNIGIGVSSFDVFIQVIDVYFESNSYSYSDGMGGDSGSSGMEGDSYSYGDG
ncbi:hypothetical protein TrST_g9778, partial [Triparma strigata]